MKKLTRFRLITLFCCSFLAINLAFAGGAMAAVMTTDMGVTAQVQAGCSEVSTTDIDFGFFTGSDLLAKGSVTVICNEGVPWGIKLDGGGLSFDPFFQQRRMTHNFDENLLAAFIGYQLYKDAARTDIWGDCVFSGFCLSPRGLEGVGSGVAQMVEVFGKAFGGSIPPAGIYVDVVHVTLEFPG